MVILEKTILQIRSTLKILSPNVGFKPMTLSLRALPTELPENMKIITILKIKSNHLKDTFCTKFQVLNRCSSQFVFQVCLILP